MRVARRATLPGAPAVPTTPTGEETVPFPLSDEELAEMAAGIGDLFAEQTPFEREVALELMKAQASGVQPKKPAPGEEAPEKPSVIDNLNEAQGQLAALAQGKGLHPIKAIDDFVPILEEMMRESPAFAASFPATLKALLVTNDVIGLWASANSTNDPRYADALKDEEDPVGHLLETAMKLFPPKDPEGMEAVVIACRNATLDLWPKVDALPIKEKAIIAATLLGLAGDRPTQKPSEQKVRDLMKSMEEQLGKYRYSVMMTEGTYMSLQKLREVLTRWQLEKQETEAAGNIWKPPTIKKLLDFHGKPTGLWQVVDEPQVIPKGGKTP